MIWAVLWIGAGFLGRHLAPPDWPANGTAEKLADLTMTIIFGPLILLCALIVGD